MATSARPGDAEGSLIRSLTARPPVSLSDIAREAGVTTSFVSMCALGQRRPTRRVREAAERLLGRSADELFSHKDD